jgi:hypothetical protein
LSTPAAPSNTAKIARNSFWYGLELSFNVVAALITSIIVARVIGPQRLDQYNFVMWLTTVTTAVGSFGLPATIRKYMAECLNRGDPGIARSIYRMGIQVQTLISGSITAVGLLLVLLSDPSQRVISGLLVLTVMPRMIVTVPSQANNAAELIQPLDRLGALRRCSDPDCERHIGTDLETACRARVAGSRDASCDPCRTEESNVHIFGRGAGPSVVERIGLGSIRLADP